MKSGTPVADKTEAAQQEARDRLRMTGYSPARKAGQGGGGGRQQQPSINDINIINIPTTTTGGGGSSTTTTTTGTTTTTTTETRQSRNEYERATGQHTQALLRTSRSPDGARVIAGRERAPRSQEDWIKWALNSADIDVPLNPSRHAGAGAGAGVRGDREKGDDAVRKASVSSTWAEPHTEDDSSSARASERRIDIEL